MQQALKPLLMELRKDFRNEVQEAIYSDLSRRLGIPPKGREFSKGILPKVAEQFIFRIYNWLPRKAMNETDHTFP